MKKVRFDIFIFLILLSSVFASCAIHEPMSEMVMFQQKKSLSDSTYYSKYSHALASYAKDLTPEKAVLDRLGHYTESDGTKHKNDYMTPEVATTSFIFLHEKHKELGVSISISSVLFGSGADFTHNIFEQYYLTGAIGLSPVPQTQIILQRRILDGNPIGLSLGPVLNLSNRYISTYNGSWIGGSKELYTASLGLRSVLMVAQMADYGEPRLFLHSSFSYNYDLALKVFYPKVGVSIGIH